MSNLFIDIETVPCGEMPCLDDIKAPANYKDEAKILEWKKANQLEVYKKQALDSMKGQIICIGYALDDDDPTTIEEHNEELILRLLLHDLLYRDWSIHMLVGWNIINFDIPWLWRKAIQYNLPDLRRILPHGNPKLCIDLMKVWAANYKDYVSLSDCAKFLGIEHDGGNGSEIYDLWQAGDLDAIAEHCKRDINTTREIYRRIYE